MQSLFQWIGNNWGAVCGWAAGFYALYKMGSIVSAFASFLFSLVTRFKNAEKTLNLLATNHLPHLQKEMEKLNDKVEELNEGQNRMLDVLSQIREDLRLVWLGKVKEHE